MILPRWYSHMRAANLAFTRDYRTYLSGDPDRQDMHDDTERMFDDLCSADLIIGFNIIQFDYKLLQPLASRHDVQLNDLPTFDILREIGELMSKPFPVSLRSLASYNLGPYGKRPRPGAYTEDVSVPGISRSNQLLPHDVWMTRMLFMIGYYEKKLFVRGGVIRRWNSTHRLGRKLLRVGIKVKGLSYKQMALISVPTTSSPLSYPGSKRAIKKGL